MPRVTSEEIAAAKSVDLLTYLQTNEPNELKKTGADEYRTVSHGSLVISDKKRLWYWNAGQIGGRSAVDYLMKVRGKGFVEAVSTVLGTGVGFSALLVEKGTKQTGFSSLNVAAEKRLILPPETKYPARAVAYLQKRGINADLIRRCLREKILYEGRANNQPVCVFVGYGDRATDGMVGEEAAEPKFANLRGIGTDLKRDAVGSDKRFGFRLDAAEVNCGRLAVFEAPIDLLSHATLALRGDVGFGTDTDFGADCHRLSLDGVSDVSLIAYLERNPNIERVSLCLDNDDAGQTAARKIFDRLAGDERFAHIKVTIDPPVEGKDYNELLVQMKRREREGREQQHKPQHRPQDCALC